MVIRDGNWKLFSHDFELGRSVWSYNDGNKTHYRIDYQVDALIQRNADMRADTAGKKFGDMSLVASVPLNVYYDQLHEAQGQHDDKYLSKWLNDGDNRAFRTKEGKV